MTSPREELLEELRLLLEVNPARLEEEYRARELYRAARVEAPLAVRLDGVGWGRRLRGQGPRSLEVHRAEARAALEAARSLGADLAYVTSDEVSLVWVSRGPPYSGRVEKLDSVASGIMSSLVSLSLGRSLYYDARIVKLHGPRDAARYLTHRARVGLNNLLLTLYHQRRLAARKGLSPPLPEVVEALRSHGLDPLTLPRWMLAGSCILPLPALRHVDGAAAVRRRWAVVEGVTPCLEALDARVETP